MTIFTEIMCKAWPILEYARYQNCAKKLVSYNLLKVRPKIQARIHYQVHIKLYLALCSVNMIIMLCQLDRKIEQAVALNVTLKVNEYQIRGGKICTMGNNKFLKNLFLVWVETGLVVSQTFFIHFILLIYSWYTKFW